jgi:UDP:flavonoid glycosyltransferase YjiC (YdhE family)
MGRVFGEVHHDDAISAGASRILIVPWPELGHIAPTLSLTRKLTHQGHCVTYLTDMQFAATIRAHGGVFCSAMGAERESREYLTGSAIHFRYMTNHGNDPLLRRFRSILVAAIREGNYALVLCDHSLGEAVRKSSARVVGAKRVVVYATTLLNWTERYECETIAMVFCPNELEIEQFRSHVPSLVHVGPSLPPYDAKAETSEKFDNGKPLVVASFGSQSVRYRYMIPVMEVIVATAQRNPGIQFIVAASSEKLHAALHGATGPNLIVRQWIPQQALLRQASALITHGGCGSLKEAICNGVPSIVIPMAYDQPFNAMRVRAHNIGSAIFPDKLSERLLEMSVFDAVRGRHRADIAKMRQIFAVREKESRAYRLIEGLLK